MPRARAALISWLILFLFLVAVWVRGAFYSEMLAYQGADRLRIVMVDHRGVLMATVAYTGSRGWDHRRERAEREDWETDLRLGGHQHLGFYYSDANIAGGPARVVGVPMWFPALFMGGVTFWLWRRSRAKGNRGFAVEGAERRGSLGELGDGGEEPVGVGGFDGEE
jgi:hypothetical protein